MRHLRLVVGVLAFLVCPRLGAQELPPAQPPRPIAESADRITRELWPLDVDGQLDEQGRPRFRSGVTALRFVLPPPWVDTEAQPSLFHPFGGSLLHHQFVESVTPEALRAVTLYPIGIKVDPGLLFHQLRATFRRREEQRIRTRIAQELEELRAQTRPETR